MLSISWMRPIARRCCMDNSIKCEVVTGLVITYRSCAYHNVQHDYHYYIKTFAVARTEVIPIHISIISSTIILGVGAECARVNVHIDDVMCV